MEQNNENSRFSYTYSATEQEELKRIRDKYTAPIKTEDKMTRLRRLDASVTQAAQCAALIFGVIGTLILGFGMSLCMTQLGESFGLNGNISMVIGIIIGIIGAVIAILAYPVYCAIVKAKRKKVALEIIRLTDELMK